MNQNLLKGLVNSLRDFLQRWDKANFEGKKMFEVVNNAFSELRILTTKKDDSCNLYTNVCQSIMEEKSYGIIKALDKLSEQLEALEKIAGFFSQQTENLHNTLLKTYKDLEGKDVDVDLSAFNAIAQNCNALKTMLANEIGLKREILRETTLLVLQEQDSVDKFNNGKFLLQLWVFNPYIPDELLDQTLKLISSA